MGWVRAGLGLDGPNTLKIFRPMTQLPSGPARPSPSPARPIGLGQGSATAHGAEPKPIRTIIAGTRRHRDDLIIHTQETKRAGT